MQTLGHVAEVVAIMKTGQGIGIEVFFALLQQPGLRLLPGQRKHNLDRDKQDDHQHQRQRRHNLNQLAALRVAQCGHALNAGVFHLVKSH